MTEILRKKLQNRNGYDRILAGNINGSIAILKATEVRAICEGKDHGSYLRIEQPCDPCNTGVMFTLASFFGVAGEVCRMI